jgi:hypothetical protein
VEGFVRNARYGSRIARLRRAILLRLGILKLHMGGLSSARQPRDPANAGSHGCLSLQCFPRQAPWKAFQARVTEMLQSFDC